MIKRLVVGVAAGLALSSTSAMAAHVEVVLMAGQSNMLGWGEISDLPTTPVNLQQPQNDVLLYAENVNSPINGQLVALQPAGAGNNNSKFGPEVTFGREMADFEPTNNFALIKYAAGGTSLQIDWKPGSGNQYGRFITAVNNGLAELTAAGHTYDIGGMLWMQGEKDALQGFEATYENNLNAFIADMRANFGARLPFVIAQLSDSQTALGTTQRSAVQQAQANVAAADEWTSLVVTNAYQTRADNIHFDSNSQMALGRDFAASYQVLTEASAPGTLGLLFITLIGSLMHRARRRVSALSNRLPIALATA